MKKSETRFINQCTHVQINPDLKSKRERVVYSDVLRKHGILTTVFDDRRIATQVLERLKTQEKYGDLCKAVGHLWDGDVAASSAIVGVAPVEDVKHFADDALAVERSLFEKAETEVGETIDSVMQSTVQKADIGEEIVTALRREMADMRRSIVEDVRGLVRQEAVEAMAARGLGNESLARASVRSEGTASATSPVQAQQSPVLQMVNLSAIQQTLLAQFPETATFLGAVRFFVQPTIPDWGAIAGIAYTQAFMDIYKGHVEQKQKQVKSLYDLMQVHPIGYLALERLNFTALGYVQGELVYSLPMLPGETVRLSHREWSRTEQEYVKLVQTSLEKDTEEVLSEKSELTHSYNTQDSHTDAFNASASVSGGFGGITFSSSVGYNTSNAESTSRQSSAKRAQEISRKAASRSKQEHKISFRVTTQYEVEEQSFREIKNESDKAVRWDFHRLMKKWRIDLYRYGERLTYDIVIPEPGSYLLRKYVLLKSLNDELAKPNPFDLAPTSITDARTGTAVSASRAPSALTAVRRAPPADSVVSTSWVELSRQYGIVLDPPPPPPPLLDIYFNGEVRVTKQQRAGLGILDMNWSEDYEFSSCTAIWGEVDHMGGLGPEGSSAEGPAWEHIDLKKDRNEYYLSSWNANNYGWVYGYDFSSHYDGRVYPFSVHLRIKLSDAGFKKWQMESFENLKDAADASYQAQRDRLTKIRDALQEELRREDALMLRKMEKEELMKGVLRWVLGPRFNFYPTSLTQLPDLKPTLEIDRERSDIEYYYNKDKQSIQSDAIWEPTLQHGEIVKYLHQAVEWENVNYLLYPYFWTDDSRWDFKQSLYHDDYVHRSFLRAGAARVVLTIRPGFEKAFVSFTETLQLDQELEGKHPYMTIAQEIENRAKETYSYTESPNKENKEDLIKFWYEFTPTGALDVAEGTVLLEDEDTDEDNIPE